MRPTSKSLFAAVEVNGLVNFQRCRLFPLTFLQVVLKFCSRHRSKDFSFGLFYRW